MYTKNRIIVYHNDGLTCKAIAEKINIHRNTVSKWINRYTFVNDISGLERIDGTGKNKKQNTENNSDVINEILNDKYLSLRELQTKLKERHPSLTLYKIRNILDERTGYE